ncbi:glycosyltransferase [Arvimicrobium flavum]|uniref:glycosyltransferase n=1 Tax=Arvimicrobium flavum TaxID=3393320 RepID=UPI00237BC941|nr:glycosyltransferase [Mesorhizobium shangrilense]
MIERQRLRRLIVRTLDLLLRGRVSELARLLVVRARPTVWASRARHLNPAPTICIDAKTQRLARDGSVAPKRSIVFPETASKLVSVIVPCNNYGAYLAEAVASVQRQTLDCVEIIVVDDGSTDPHTVTVLGELANDPALRIISKPQEGLVSARNAGIAVANGEYVCCLDADDRLLPGYLEAAVLALETDRSVGFAYSWAQLFGDEHRVWHTRDFRIDEGLADNHTAVSAVFRRDDWHEIGGYRPQMRHGYEDWEFWLRLAALGRNGKAVRAPLFEHRRHGRTMTHDAHAMRRRLVSDMRALNTEIFSDRSLQSRISRIGGPANADRSATAIPVRLPVESGKPHLLVVVPWLEAGGAEMVLLDVLDHLKASWTITIVTTLPDRQPLWSEFVKITTDIFPLAGAFDSDGGLRLLEHLVASRQISVVLSSGSGWLYRNAARLKSRFPALKLVDLLHNALPSGHLADAVAASAVFDRHIAVSPHIETALVRRGVYADKVRTILNGVDCSAARLDGELRKRCRAELGLDPDVFAIGWVGRFAAEKRPLDFLYLVSSLPDSRRVAAFMCGEGPQLQGTIDRSVRMESAVPVNFLGRRSRPDMRALYAAFDVLVLTSELEGMPLVVLEALGAGCPVVATRVGDIELAVHDGRSGWLVPPGDIAAMRRRILEMMANTSEHQAMAAYALATMDGGDFSRKAMAEAYARVFVELVSWPAGGSGPGKTCNSPRSSQIDRATAMGGVR